MSPHASSPGLDLASLQALRRSRPTDHLQQRMRAHLDTHDGYLAFSGGKDSLVVLHLALTVDPNVPVAFFDSGLEYPETYTYLADLEQAWDLDLHVYPARRTTLQVLVDDGGWDHTSTARSRENLHQVLITEPAARAHHDHGPGELWGVRAAEARGRSALYATQLARETEQYCTGCCDNQRDQRNRHGGVTRRQDGTTAYGPVWDWTDTDVWSYIARHHLPVNPVYAKLRALGAPEHFLRVSHVLDGNRLDEGRATWLRRGWPDLHTALCQVLPRLREFS